MLEQPSAGSTEAFLENIAFQKVKCLLSESGSVDCSGYREEFLKRRFEIRLNLTGAKSYGRYLIYLKKHPEELTNLLNDLTVNFTTFFRDDDVYKYLERVLLPKLFLSKYPVRIWSAGCATGEEPYSLAILVRKAQEKAGNDHLATIYASDIDQDALSKASAAVYHQRQLGSMGQKLIKEFFAPEGGRYRVNDEIRRMVHFQHLDLMNPPIHHNLDLILCRNVMIYFSRDGQQKIHMNFFQALKGGGYFITGKSELLTGQPSKKFISVDFQTRVYQKPPSAV